MASSSRRFIMRLARNFLVAFLVGSLAAAVAAASSRHAPPLPPRDGFDVFISREEMNRTLGIMTEMSYVDDGVVNAYSTKFPYRIAANITHLTFTWHANRPGSKIKYTVDANTENFDIVSVLHLPGEGYVPDQLQTFVVEYRCAGNRAGQFPVTISFEVAWPSADAPTKFALRQEKICAPVDGRRVVGFSPAGEEAQLDTRLIIGVAAAICSALTLICTLLVCASASASRKRECASGGSALAPMMGAGAAAHSFYTAAAMLGKNGFNDQVSPATNFCAATTTTMTGMSTPVPRQVTVPLLASTTSGAATVALAAAKTSVESRRTSAAVGDVVNLDNALTQPLFIDANNEVISRPSVVQPLTSTPYSNANIPRLPRFDMPPGDADLPKIVFERRGNIVNINNALVELNADRNLFVLMPQIEMEGKFGEIRWANWRQTGIGTSGDIDDEEDDANEDTALICKTLKSSTDRVHFETFLKDALALHNVPAHPNLAQVIAAATFGNFNNPNSVKDFPLICYRHSGFGILKKFLRTCRGINGALAVAASVDTADPIDLSQPVILDASLPQNLLTPTLRVHDLVSISSQVLKAVQHLHKFGIIHKDIASRNCLISEVPVKLSSSHDRLYVQLMDNALSQDLYPDDYAEMAGSSTTGGIVPFDDAPSTSAAAAAVSEVPPNPGPIVPDLLPLKWMAPEVIRSRVYNSSTDVWTFGMFMWELFTCGQSPFADVAVGYVELAIASGARPAHPAYNCPDEIYGIMFSCWHHDPLQRPSVEQLLRVIADFARRLDRYI